MSDEPEDQSEDQELVHLELSLRAFSDEPRCPKCQSRALHTAWHTNIVSSPEPQPCETWWYSGLLQGVITEHLCRRCMTCGYGWPERTADS